MWVMGMALEEDERTVARERAERKVARDAEKMEHDTAQDLEGRLLGTTISEGAAITDNMGGP